MLPADARAYAQRADYEPSHSVGFALEALEAVECRALTRSTWLRSLLFAYRCRRLGLSICNAGHCCVSSALYASEHL